MSVAATLYLLSEKKRQILLSQRLITIYRKTWDLSDFNTSIYKAVIKITRHLMISPRRNLCTLRIFGNLGII